MILISFTGISINVSLGINMLTVGLAVPDRFKGNVSGLVGNYDGNKDNDFQLPDGRVLTPSEVDTERKIYDNFGQKCELK